MIDEQHQQGRDDPLIDEIRAIRKRISNQFDNDVDRLCDYLKEFEKRHSERLVSPPGFRAENEDRK